MCDRIGVQLLVLEISQSTKYSVTRLGNTIPSLKLCDQARCIIFALMETFQHVAYSHMNCAVYSGECTSPSGSHQLVQVAEMYAGQPFE